jgi:tetratricopeptide (TPR) repeat protein
MSGYFMKLGDVPSARAAMAEAAKNLEKLQLHDGVKTPFVDLALTYQDLAVLDMGAGEHDEAAAWFEAAISEWDALVVRNHSSVLPQSLRASCLCKYSEALTEIGEFNRALVAAQDAVDVLCKLCEEASARDRPEFSQPHPELAQDLALAHTQVALVYECLGNIGGALQENIKAIHILESVEPVSFVPLLPILWRGRSKLLLRENREIDAAESLRQAIDLWEAAGQQALEDPDFAAEFGQARLDLQTIDRL